MTKEELKKEAEEWVKISNYPYSDCPNIEKKLKQAYLASAEPREKQIQALSKHCLQLQQDKGELIDELRELEAQIEKMKCCANCGWFYLQQHWRESKEIDESRMFHCGTCGNKKNWKLKEVLNDS